MIIFEILLFLLLLAGLVYFAFFSKKVQKVADKAEDRTRSLADDTAVDALQSRADAIEAEKKNLTQVVEEQKAAVKAEQARLDQIQVK